MADKMSRQSNTNQPFGSNPVWIERWRNLIRWWEECTGRRLGICPGRIFPSLREPPSVADVDCYWMLDDPEFNRATKPSFRGWLEQDPAITEFLCNNNDFLYLAGLGSPQLWEWAEIGQAEVNERAALHDKMVHILKELLALSHPGSWWANVGYGIPGIGYGMGCGAVDAARLLLSLPNPFPRVSEDTQTIKVRHVQEKRHAAKLLYSLAASSGRRQTDEELAVFYLLTCPDAIGQIRKEVRWWEGASGWEYVGGSEDTDAAGFINESVAFSRLARNLRHYRETD